jgi:hypothetical protein
MPYYLFPACPVRAYSAARESSCPECDAPLRGVNQIHPSMPPAQSLGGGRARPEADDALARRRPGPGMTASILGETRRRMRHRSTTSTRADRALGA